MQELEDIIEFVNNPEPRCPVILLLDTSYSMSGEPIRELNTGVATFTQEVQKHDKASSRVDVAIITFGGKPELIQNFITFKNFKPKPLSANGETPMGQAIELALDKLEQRKTSYKKSGITYYRPWVLLITDGAPTDNWQNAAQRVSEAEKNDKLSFFAIGVNDADMAILEQIANENSPLKLDGLKFTELFRWLSNSMRKVSTSKIGDQVELPPTKGWTTVTA